MPISQSSLGSTAALWLLLYSMLPLFHPTPSQVNPRSVFLVIKTYVPLLMGHCLHSAQPTSLLWEEGFSQGRMLQPSSWDAGGKEGRLLVRPGHSHLSEMAKNFCLSCLFYWSICFLSFSSWKQSKKYQTKQKNPARQGLALV